MSWQLVCVLVLAVVLAGGFAWYERSRPSSRLVALVAALAALAVAGRVALAPIPNVVATTDVVLFAGYALGAAPGFVVGALAALVSNFWLGQGPWTPWQMAGWGLVGIGGAALARIAGRELGRLALAAAAATAGLLYGALLDLSAMVNFGGEQSLDRYLALSARGLPFNIAHAAGNAALALAAGPAFVAMLSRFRDRATVVWRERGVPAGAITAVVLALLAGAGAITAEPARAGPAEAARWLRSVQNSDGGYGPAPGEPSSLAMTGWVALGLEAAGVNPADVRRGGPSALDYLRDRAGGLTSVGDLERTILAVSAAGFDPRDFGGRDLVAALVSRRRADGSWGGQVNLTAYGVLALGAAGESGLRDSARWLARARNGDEGWGFAPGASSDPDSTGAALEALALAGGQGEALASGVRFLRRSQRGDGGWALDASTGSNAQSTALALQGLIAAGASPGAIRSDGRSGLDYLGARQAGDGRYDYSASSGRTAAWVTAQATIAAAGRALPLAPVPRAPSSARNSGSGRGGGAKARSGGGRPERDRGSGVRKKRRDRGGRARDGSRAGKRARATTADAGAYASPSDALLEERVRSAVGEPGSGGRSSTAVIVAVFVIFAGLLAGGFFLYRRRLPPV